MNIHAIRQDVHDLMIYMNIAWYIMKIHDVSKCCYLCFW
jgi:hypothetical protein